MQVNTNVYGAPDTWLHVFPYSGYNTENTNLIPAWQTIAGGISADKVDFSVPLDNTICYCAIAEDSPAAGAYFAAGDDLSHPIETKPFKEDFFISAGDYTSGLFNSIPYYDITDNYPQKYTYANGTTPVSNNPNTGLKPLCSVSLKDLVLCVYVVGYNSDYTDYKVSTYNGYKQQYSASHPNITQIYAIPYCRNENSNTRFAMTNSESFNFSGFARMGLYDLPNNMTSQFDYFSNINRDNGLNFHIWGIPASNGQITFFSASPNYIYRAFGSGGEFVSANGNLYYSRPWGAGYQEHARGDWIRRAAASFGCFFVDRTSYAQNAAYASANMCLGTIDENGLCHGDYTSGSDNTEQPQYNWTSTNDSKYNPDAPIDKNKYSIQTTFNTVGDYNGMVNRYVLDGAAVRALSTSLWAVMGDLITDAGGDYANLEGVDYENFLTANPMDCIIDLRKYPFKDIPAKGHWDAATQKNINFGKKASSAAGYEFNYTMFEYAFTNVDIFPRFGGCFLDYAPYTTMELYVPFCGTVELNPADFMGHTLKVFMEIDYTTGTCVTYICADSLVIKSVNGTVAIDIPVSGTNSARLMSELNNAVVAEGAARASLEKAKVKNYFTLKGAVAGSMDLYTGGQFGVTGKLNKAMTAGERWTQKGAEYNLTHQEQPVNVIKSCSSAGGWAIDLKCRLIIYYPGADFIDWINNKPSLNLDKLSTYAHLNGFACLENKTLDNFSGYTVISEIDLSNCSASETEKQLIKGLLQSGVYL